jgi:hypothetical protein
MIKSRRMRLSGHMEEMKNTLEILTRNPEGERLGGEQDTDRRIILKLSDM